jgi:hypothetical protein
MFRSKTLTLLAAPILALSLLVTGCGKVKPGSRTAPARGKPNSSGSPTVGGGTGGQSNSGSQYPYWVCGTVEGEGDYSSMQYSITVVEAGVSIRVFLIPFNSSIQEKLFSANKREACALSDQDFIDYGPYTSYFYVKSLLL